jgi:hypothetical protein
VEEEEVHEQNHRDLVEVVASLVAARHIGCSCFGHHMTVAISSLSVAWCMSLTDCRNCTIPVHDHRIDLSAAVRQDVARKLLRGLSLPGYRPR